MSIPKEILKQYDVKLIDRWTPPKEGEDIRPLIAMPNLPKPTHAMAPRTLLGSAMHKQIILVKSVERNRKIYAIDTRMRSTR